MVNSFNPGSGSAGAGVARAVSDVCLNLVWLGLACMVASYLEVAAWMTIGAHVRLPGSGGSAAAWQPLLISRWL